MAHEQYLRSYLAKLFFAAIVPLLVLAGLLIYQVVGSERETRLQAMQDLARTLSASVDAEVERSLLALQMLAASEGIERRDLGSIRARLEEAKALHGRWSSMSLFATDGTRLINLGIPSGQPIPSSPAAQIGLDDAIRQGRVFVSNVVVSSTSGKPTVFFGVPVFRNGVPVYGITASMEYDVWTGWLKQRIPEGAIAAIDDSSGVIFARSERPEPFAGKPAADAVRQAYTRQPSGLVRSANREGVDIYVAYTTSQRTGWHTLIITTATALDAGPLRYGMGFAAATVVVLLLTLLAAIALARPLAQGIGHLRDSIRRVGLGERPAAAVHPIAELNEAERAARQAADQLAAARDELVRQREELRTMLDLLPVGVAVAHDAQARQVSTSPMFDEIVGVQRSGAPADRAAAAPPRPYRCLQGGQEIREDQLPLQTAARTGAMARNVEIDIELPDGAVSHMLVNAAPLYDDAGRTRGAIAAYINVTTLKRAQQSLQLADRQKNEFLATLAHELRNPMAPIRYATALLQRDATPALVAQARITIERQSAHMARLLDDLLDLSRISRNVVELQRELVDLQPIVQAAVDNARPAVEEHKHTLQLQAAPEPLWVLGDPARLLQILDNLLSNACKYTPAGGRIVVHTRREGQHAEVQVSDNGAGLTPDMIPQLFTMFGQLHRGLSGTRAGLGIGLTVVRRLVELHEGTVDVHSAGLGAGSSFTVRLPLSLHPGAQEHGRALPQALGVAGLDVLVVDDNVDAAQTLAVVLELAGCSVRVAHTAQAALASADQRRPDAAVLDIGLPDGSGNDLARQLRRRPGGERIALVAVTGWGQAQDRDQTFAAGFDTHLVKPVEPQQLLDTLQTAVQARGVSMPLAPAEGD